MEDLYIQRLGHYSLMLTLQRWKQMQPKFEIDWQDEEFDIGAEIPNGGAMVRFGSKRKQSMI